MRIKTPADLEGLRAAGRVCRLMLGAMRSAVEPGITTRELNAIGTRIMKSHGARSAPMLIYGFPAEICISVNDEVVHGIPSRRKLAAGDLVKLDVTVEKDGYMADAAITAPVGRVGARATALAACAARAFRAALRVARAGNQVRDIGGAVEEEVARRGFRVVRGLNGHGIGRTIHEPPEVPNWLDPSATARLTEGLVITIEPILAMGNGQSFEDEDGWTVRTADGSLAAHHEHTIVVGNGPPELLTA